MKRVAEASPQNNLTCIVKDRKEFSDVDFGPSDIYACRCALVESQPSQIDFKEKILMLEDERIICYDTLTIS